MMFWLAVATVRERRASFIGAIVAMALGVGLLSASGLLLASVLTQSGAGRVGAVDAAVVSAASITVGHGDGRSVVKLHPPPRVPAGLVNRVRAIPGVTRAVGDLAFPVVGVAPGGEILAARGADRTEGHGRSSASLTPYRLSTGRAPARGEVVFDHRLEPRVRIGQSLQLVVPIGVRTLRVSGIAAAVGSSDRGQSAFFFNDQDAALFSGTPGKVNAIAVLAAPGVAASQMRSRIARRLGNDFSVLPRSQAADAHAGNPHAQQVEDVTGYLATMGPLASAVALFIVASTFALTLAQRRQELALLRAIGGDPGQIRRMIASEALVIALIGGAAGCALGACLASPLPRALVDRGLAPIGLRTGPNAFVFLGALTSGVFVAEIAAVASSLRVPRLRPAEALSGVSDERYPVGVLRWVLGLSSLGGGGTLVVLFSGDLALDFAEVAALLFALGVALLAPLALGLPMAMLSLPLRLSAPGLLASTAIAN
ncbi:MAG TPA: ABC transporter permease, partial [Solirubrobacteraceae bacterium]